MRKLFEEYSEAYINSMQQGKDRFITSEDGLWCINFFSNLADYNIHFSQNHLIYIRNFSYTYKKEPTFYGLDIYIDHLISKIKYIEYIFYYDIPDDFYKIDNLSIVNAGERKVIKYSTRVLHENRLFFNKKLLLFGLPKKILKIVDQFFDSDDPFKKIKKSQRNALCCRFFKTSTKDWIPPGVQKYIKEYLAGKQEEDIKKFNI